jgi:two-component system LytT family sensor kinase
MKYRPGILFISFLVFYYCWTFIMDLSDGDDIDFFEGMTNNSRLWIIEITSTLYMFLYVFTTYTLLWYFSKQKQFLLAFTLIIVLSPIIILTRYALEEIISPALWGVDNYSDNILLPQYLMDNKYFAIIYCAFGIAYFFIQYGRHKEAVEVQIRLQHQQAELDFLKSQINPHFLFNSLNNIYALIYHQSPHALTAVDKLSGLLRYMLYEKNDTVPLSKETEYLQHFIELQKLRYDFEFPLDIVIEMENPQLAIAPLILIPFLENAFKHGQFGPVHVPLKVHLLATDTSLTYEVCNEKSNSPKDVSSGIGLENVKRRLDLLYAGRYEWTTTESESTYCSILKIKVK